MRYSIAVLTRREFGAATAAGVAQAQAQVTAPLYFDLHIDTPARMVNEGLNLADSDWHTCVDIPKMKQGGLNAGFFAVFAPARGVTPAESVRQALVITDVIVEEVKRHPADLFLGTTSKDVLRARREGKIAILLGVEGGHMIDSSLEILRQLYRLGARYMGLTHSGNTPWVGAAEYHGEGPKGLTGFGKEVVREMNRLGMMVDLSHASEQAFYDAVETSKAPILNTHAACRTVANHPRNLTDDMLKALGRNRGVLGVAYYGGMLDDDYRARFPQLLDINRKRAEVGKQFRDDKKRLGEELWKLNQAEVKTIGQPSISRLVDHIEHAAAVAGIDHVGLGSDFGRIGGHRQDSQSGGCPEKPRIQGRANRTSDGRQCLAGDAGRGGGCILINPCLVSGGDGGKRPSVTALDTHTCRVMANVETNGETDNAPNAGKMKQRILQKSGQPESARVLPSAPTWRRHDPSWTPNVRTPLTRPFRFLAFACLVDCETISALPL
jgi:membrane dipeptidase